MDTSVKPGGDASARPTREPIWTRTYALLLGSQSCTHFHHGLLQPTLPLYATHLGASELYVGLTLAAFSATTFAIRPLIGYLADTRNLVLLLAMGALLLGLAGTAFLIPVFVLLVLANAVRGIGWAGLNTAANTLLAHIAPVARRGEASGYYTLFQSAATALAPPLALWLVSATQGSFVPVILLAGVCGLAGFGLAMAISRSAGRPAAGATGAGRDTGGISVGRLYDPGVVLAAALLVCLTLSQPAAHGFVALYGQTLGLPLEQIAWYYIALGAVALTARGTLGGLSDRFGRGRAVVLGYGLSAIGLVLLATATDVFTLVAAGVFYAAGGAVLTPATLALAMDRADPRRRGTAMANYTMGYGIGTSTGAAITGALVEAFGYREMYAAMLVAVLVGLTITAANWGTLKPSRAK